MSSYSLSGAGSATVRKQLIFLQLSTREAQQTASVPRRVLDPLRKNPLFNNREAKLIPISQILKNPKISMENQQQQQREQSQQLLLSDNGMDEEISKKKNSSSSSSSSVPSLLKTPTPGTPEYEAEFDLHNFPILPLFAVTETRTVLDQIRQVLSNQRSADGAEHFKNDQRLVPLKQFYSYYNQEHQDKQINDQLTRERNIFMAKRQSSSDTNQDDDNDESNSTAPDNTNHDVTRKIASFIPNYVNVYKKLHREDWMPFVEPAPMRYSNRQSSNEAIRLPSFTFGQPAKTQQQRENETSSSVATASTTPPSIPHFLNDPFQNINIVDLGIFTVRDHSKKITHHRQTEPRLARFYRAEKPPVRALAYTLTPVRQARSSDHWKSDKEKENVFIDPSCVEAHLSAKEETAASFDYEKFVTRCPASGRPWVTMFGLSVPFATSLLRYFQQYDSYVRLFGHEFGVAAARHFLLPVAGDTVDGSDSKEPRNRSGFRKATASLHYKIMLYKAIKVHNAKVAAEAARSMKKSTKEVSINKKKIKKSKKNKKNMKKNKKNNASATTDRRAEIPKVPSVTSSLPSEPIISGPILTEESVKPEDAIAQAAEAEVLSKSEKREHDRKRQLLRLKNKLGDEAFTKKLQNQKKLKVFSLSRRIRGDSLCARLLIHGDPQKYNPHEINTSAESKEAYANVMCSYSASSSLSKLEPVAATSFETIDCIIQENKKINSDSKKTETGRNSKTSTSSSSSSVTQQKKLLPENRIEYKKLEFEELPAFWWWYVWEHRNVAALMPLLDPQLLPVSRTRPFLFEEMRRTYMDMLHDQHEADLHFAEQISATSKPQPEIFETLSSSFCAPREVIGNPIDYSDKWRKFLLRQSGCGDADAAFNVELASVDLSLSSSSGFKNRNEWTGLDVAIHALEIQLFVCNVDQISRLIASYRQFEDDLYVKQTTFEHHVQKQMKRVQDELSRAERKLKNASPSELENKKEIIIYKASSELMSVLPSTPVVDFRTTFLHELRRWRYWRMMYSFYPTFAVKIAILVAAASLPMKLPRLPMLMTAFEKNDAESIEYLKKTCFGGGTEIFKLHARAKEVAKSMLNNSNKNNNNSNDKKSDSTNHKKKQYEEIVSTSLPALLRVSKPEIVETSAKPTTSSASHLLLDFPVHDDPRTILKKLLLKNCIEYKLPVVYYQVHHSSMSVEDNSFDGEDDVNGAFFHHGGGKGKRSKRITKTTLSRHDEADLSEMISDNNTNTGENEHSLSGMNNGSMVGAAKRGRRKRKPFTREVLINRTATKVFRSAICAIDAVSFWQYLCLTQNARHEIWKNLPKNQRLVLDNTNFKAGNGEKPEDPMFDFMRYRLQLDAEEFQTTGGGLGVQLKKEAELRRQLNDELRRRDAGEPEKQQKEEEVDDANNKKTAVDDTNKSNDETKTLAGSAGLPEAPKFGNSRDTSLLVKALRNEWNSLHPMDQAAFYNMEYIQNIFPDFKGFSSKDVVKFQRDWAYGDEATQIAAEENRAQLAVGTGERWIFGTSHTMDAAAQLGRQRLLRESERELAERTRNSRKQQYEERKGIMTARHHRGMGSASAVDDYDDDMIDEDDEDEDEMGAPRAKKLEDDEDEIAAMNEYTLSGNLGNNSHRNVFARGGSLMKSLKQNDVLHEVKGAPTFLM